MCVTNIVLTGGPCAGKSTGLSRIEQELTDKGYKVFVVPETATENITGGIRLPEVPVNDFQKAIFEVQLSKEKVYRDVANVYSKLHNTPCVIVYDRGLLDAKAFMKCSEYKLMCESYGLKESELRDNYDAVIHLKTAADGAESFYTLANNVARSETPAQAREVDKKIIKAWTGHPHLRVIDNSTNFDGKIDRLMSEIFSILGEPIPTEIERKFLIEKPSLEELKDIYNLNKVSIIQTYLESSVGVERRVRQRGIVGTYSYYYTEKRGEGIERIETEKKITKDEYLDYLMEADTSLKQIRKDRYCFVYDNSYIEMDIYPFWKDYAIVEVELTNKEELVSLPPEIKVIKEVTEDKRFKNSSLAKNNSFDVLE